MTNFKEQNTQLTVDQLKAISGGAGGSGAPGSAPGAVSRFVDWRRGGSGAPGGANGMLAPHGFAGGGRQGGPSRCPCGGSAFGGDGFGYGGAGGFGAGAGQSV
ncbi:hypothetical protein [Synechococcus sp. MIT S9451]|uniref:hypothetical protein n=1 Tax=Synechococcus sp. MIT S9451 TaxID=3082543 RepID=UPI0039B64CCF